VHRYRFTPQETELRGGETVHAAGGAKLGQVEDISVAESWVEIKKRKDSAGLHPEALFGHNDVDTKVLAEALLRIGEYAADKGLEGEGRYLAARDILLRISPRVGGQTIRKTHETALAPANRLALALDGGVLPIQGPSGSGKTYTGARMIVTMVGTGLRVGVTANSHKVIRNLLDAVCLAADESEVELTCIQKVPEETPDEGRLRFTTDNGICLSALHGDCRVAGGTAWFWARPDALIRSISSSSMRLRKCRSRTYSRCHRPRKLWSFSATRNSSISPLRAVIQMALTHPRSTTSLPVTKLSRKIVGFFWKRRGGFIPRFAHSLPSYFTKVGCDLAPAWTCRRSDQGVNSRARDCATAESHIPGTRAPRWRRPTPSAT